MKPIQNIITGFFTVALLSSCSGNSVTYDLADYGIKPDTKEDISPLMASAIKEIKSKHPAGKQIVLTLSKGRYDFYPENAEKREYFISNHDQVNPKSVGVALEGMNNLVFDGNEADFIFHGRMLPVSLIESENITLRNFSIDFENPHITQVKVLENNPDAPYITFEVAPWAQYEIRDNRFVAKGEDWESRPSIGIAFEEKTKRLIYNTSDIYTKLDQVSEIAPRTIKAEGWKDARLIPGSAIALRTYYRPAPGIFISHDKNVSLENIRVHYAEGMGLLAQMTENITLDRFSVCLRGDSDPRYFTTQADATHFSACKGKIISKNGLYEGMMDDAINVHGTYLKVMKREDDKRVLAAYMHPQAYGFEWGRPGDAVQFVNSATMELVGEKNNVATIRPVDKETVHGAKLYEITFENALDTVITEQSTFGIENLEWTPEVVFSDNVIRNNRARGTLFSTPKRTIVENNLFDHTSGTAILLCGDCNGWFETGACRDVVIRNNRFVNALTNMFQFTNAVISIYPEIPNLKDQQKYFHGGEGKGVLIENNTFEMFDAPIVYAKSIDGLVFKGNKIIRNNEYTPFHWNKKPFFFQRAVNVVIEDNLFENQDFDYERDVIME